MGVIRSKGVVEFTDAHGRVSGRLAGKRLSDAELYAIARKTFGAGWTAITMTAIALAESQGYTEAEGDLLRVDATWGPSRGLWQIRSNAQETRNLFDPEVNAAAAKALWKTRKYAPWGAYRNGSYRKFMLRARRAARLAGANL